MKVAIIGRGFGAYAMKPAFEARGWEAELVPSRDPDAVAAACKGDFDLIAIHSPPFQHREHVLRAVEAGKDVLCDKPFGRTAAEAREMRDAAKAAGVLHFVNFEFRQNAGRRKVNELLAAGAIGTLVHAHYVSFANFMRKRDHGWLNDASLGGGWLGALGSHIIDAMRWQFGSEIVDCGGMSRVEVKQRPDGQGGTAESTAEDAFSVWLKLASGGTAVLESAASAAVALPQSMTFLGTEGCIELQNEAVVKLTRGKEEAQVFDCTPAPAKSGWAPLEAWIDELAAALNSRTQLAPNFDDGVATAEVMEQLKARMIRA